MLNLFIITIAAFLYLYAGMYYTIFIDGDPDVFNFKRFSLDFEEDSPNYTIILGYILMYVLNLQIIVVLLKQLNHPESLFLLKEINFFL